MASLTPWTWVWANSGRGWRLECCSCKVGSQRIRQDWTAEQQQRLLYPYDSAYHISQLALATTILSSRSDLIFFLWFVTDLRLSSEPVPEWLSRISFPLKKFLKQPWRKCKKECNDHPPISQHVLILGNISWMRITLKIWILLSLNTYCQIVSKKHCAKT